MDLMDVPEPGASASPWGAGAGARAAAASEDPWQPYGIHIYSIHDLYWEWSHEMISTHRLSL